MKIHVTIERAGMKEYGIGIDLGKDAGEGAIRKAYKDVADATVKLLEEAAAPAREAVRKPKKGTRAPTPERDS